MFSSQLTSTVSVAIVLLILGIVALIGIAAHNAAREIQEQTGFVVIMEDDADEARIRAMKSLWVKATYVSDFKYASADEVMRRWREMMGTDDLPDETDLGGNPFSPEFEVNLRAEYAYPDSVDSIIAAIEKYPGVSEIRLYGDTVAEVNRSIRSVMFILLIIAGALLLISFVLINNTVRLAIFSKRFIIHTMKLVGATASFIRRPFVIEHIISGIIAATLASAILASMIGYLSSIEPMLPHLVSWETVGYVIGAMFVTGALLSGLAAAFGATRYITISYDELFE